METFITRPVTQPIYTVRPEHSHSRVSLYRVLYAKFLRWVDKASPRAMLKALGRTLTVVTLLLLLIAPQFLLGFSLAALRWNQFGLLRFTVVIVAVFYWKAIVKLWKRYSLKTGNQHTYHGIPIDPLVTFLIEEGKFTREDAMRVFGISQDKHAAMATEMERHAVLVRGENNARVLNDISRENLVRQLRDKFPLVWSEEHRVWAERTGTFERWALDKDRKEKDEREKVARLERKRDRLKAQNERLSLEAHAYA